MRVDLDRPPVTVYGDSWGNATDIAIVDSSVYVVGYTTQHTASIGPRETPCIWTNGIRTDLAVGGSLGGEANRLAVIGGDVYISGYYIEAEAAEGDTLKICFWKNGNRTDIKSVTGLPSLMVFGIAVSGTDAFLCGASESESIPGNLVPSYWKISDTTVPMTVLDCGAATKAGIIGLEFDGANIYATGGTFTEAAGWQPVVWKNGSLSELEIIEAVPGDNALQVGISLVVDGSDIYVAGMRYSPYASNSGEVPALWKNGELVDPASMNTYGTLMDIAIRRY
jgi:hypothetical protein